MNVYDTQITIVDGFYKPTYDWGGPHCCDYDLVSSHFNWINHHWDFSEMNH